MSNTRLIIIGCVLLVGAMIATGNMGGASSATENYAKVRGGG